MRTVITIRLAHVYGRYIGYPADRASQEVLKLTGTKTLTPGHLRILRNMGCDIAVTGQNTAVQFANLQKVLAEPG
jgi:hypothetical protein